MSKQIAPCPKCKDSVGWYEKRIVSYQQFYNADGSDSHAADDSGRGGKRKYCYNCCRDITKLINDEE